MAGHDEPARRARCSSARWRCPRRRRRARRRCRPSRLSLADGRVTLSGDVSADVRRRRPGFFNYTDYEHSALRMFRVDLTAAVKAGRPRLAARRDPQREPRRRSRPYALLPAHPAVDARATSTSRSGRVPPTFGAFARRTYANDNPLIGYPLAYQYLTSLRADALPANADELLAHARPRLARRSYSVGDPAPAAACRSSARSAGTPACRCTRRSASSSATASVTDRHALESAVLGRQLRPPARRARRAAPGRRA